MITSILDNDLYSFSQQWAIHKIFPKTKVKFLFTNRNLDMKFNEKCFKDISSKVKSLADLKLSEDEEEWIRYACPFLPDVYIGYLKQYRFNPDCVSMHLDGMNLSLEINGYWDDIIMFEVALMAIISESYFMFVDTDWIWDEKAYYSMSWKKGLDLDTAGCRWADFGTRRRRSYDVHDCVVKAMSCFTNFVGTSNVHFAHKYGLKPIGTMAHQWIMGNSALCSLRYANKYALQNWLKVYGADLGVALADTYGTDAFLQDFDMFFAKLFDGPRHDSGCPIEFANKIVAHYKSLRVNPLHKSIVFSDGLDVDKAIEIKKHCNGKINCSFGIGTHFTNDFIKKSDPSTKSKALNMVIKLRTCNGVEVVKISDNVIKVTGDKKAIDVAKWTFKGLI